MSYRIIAASSLALPVCQLAWSLGILGSGRDFGSWLLSTFLNIKLRPLIKCRDLHLKRSGWILTVLDDSAALHRSG